MPSEIHSEDTSQIDLESDKVVATLFDQDMLMQKNEEIELLQEQLAKERERLHQLEIRLSELTEELTIQTGKCAQAIQERDQFQNKLKESINRLQQFRDEAVEKDEKIQYLGEKLECLQTENQSVRDQNLALIAKNTSVMDNYYLVPLTDDLKGGHGLLQESKVTKLIHDEIRNLHLQLKNKEKLIESLKQGSSVPLDQMLNAEEAQVQ